MSWGGLRAVRRRRELPRGVGLKGMPTFLGVGLNRGPEGPEPLLTETNQHLLNVILRVMRV